jgi:hypothetical protein
VGGHYSTGEDAAVAGPREIQEELGIDVCFGDLLCVGRRIFVYCFAPGIKEYEFQDVFLLRRNIRPEQLMLQPEELDGTIELDVEKGIELFSGKTLRAQVPFTKTGGETAPVSITIDDFVPCLDKYYLKLLLLVQRYVNGDREHLLI